MTQTSRLRLPFLEAGQVSKELFHNESLRLVDIAVGAAVDGVGVNTPPASPADGQCFILGAAPTGVWAGHARASAGYGAGGWRFVEPVVGLTARDNSSGQTALFNGTAWEVGTVRGSQLVIGGNQLVGARLSAIANPSGGASVDAEARTAIVAILDRMRQHGLIAP
jgi:hypothetical protein